MSKYSHRYSYSQIQLYAECPTKYLHRYINCLTPLAGESEHDLRYGKAIDAALNAYYGRDRSVLDASIAFQESYPESDYPVTLPNWSLGKTFQNGLSALAAYAEHWQRDDENWEIVGVQSSQRSEEDDLDSDRLVRIDLVIRDLRDGLIYGVDHKSTGKYLDQDYNLKFKIHSQIRQYVDRLQRKHGECGGFYINALSFRHRSKAYTPRSGPDKGIQLPAGDWHSFKRLVFTPNREAIRTERVNFDSWVAKIESDRTTGVWGYNTDQCVKGSIICPYHEICSAGYSWPRDEDLIRNYYRQRCIRLTGNGERCWLAPGHEGECDSTRPQVVEPEVEFDEEIEEAVE